MLAKLFGSALYGVDAFRITIEVSVGNGLGCQLTGLPDDAIKESLSRIEVAIKSNGYQMPRTKLVINLAPADVRKSGTAFDLPITLGILLATGQLTDLDKLKDYIIIGEIGLDGSLHPVRGALCMAYQARQDGFKGIVVPLRNAEEASLVQGIDVYGVSHLREVIGFITSDCMLDPTIGKMRRAEPIMQTDFKDVRGQERVKRALEIAAAGGHNTLLIGPPGIGKSMLAKRLPSILPPMTLRESLETTRIYSVLNHTEPLTGLIQQRPFRSPHHTASDVALVGGGSIPMPGEISLAHNGVLFLDELPEFKRSTIEVIRQPLEDRKVLIARAKMSLEYPATFMLAAAMNPCLCGYFGHPRRACTCSRRALYWYRRRVSGPLLERIDLQVDVDPVPFQELMESNAPCESSSTIRQRVLKARRLQTRRFGQLTDTYCNAQMRDSDIAGYCPLEEHARKFLFRKMDQWQLSARSYTRILKLGRTIADLAGTDQIELSHIAEALSYRALDRMPLKSPPEKPKTRINTIYSHPGHDNGT
jgi:magnesium chelatase family protein